MDQLKNEVFKIGSIVSPSLQPFQHYSERHMKCLQQKSTKGPKLYLIISIITIASGILNHALLADAAHVRDTFELQQL